MRRDHDQFIQRDAVVISVGPESAGRFRSYWQKNSLPFIGLPDNKHALLKLYGQEVRLFKLGRQPAQMLIDKKGMLRYAHYGHSMSDIPGTKEMLELLDELEAGSG